MQIYYLIPVVLIVGALLYSAWMKKRLANLSPEEAAERFHAHNAQYFELEGDEKVVRAWSGVEFQGAKSLEFVQLRGDSDGDGVYEAWLSPQGGRVGQDGFVSIHRGLS